MRFCLELKTAITEQSAGDTLIESVAKRFTYCDRAAWHERITSGQLKVNGLATAPDVVLKPGD